MVRPTGLPALSLAVLQQRSWSLSLTLAPLLVLLFFNEEPVRLLPPPLPLSLAVLQPWYAYWRRPLPCPLSLAVLQREYAQARLFHAKSS